MAEPRAGLKALQGKKQDAKTGRPFKMGRNRPVAVAPHMKLRNYLTKGLPAPPASCDYTKPSMSALSNVYENNSLGCCVVSGMAHVIATLTGNAGDLFTFSDQQIIALYSAIGGYVPGDPSTDQGCDEVTALNYWIKQGAPIGSNKILGYLSVDPTDLNQVHLAQFLFENLYFGIELPDAWVNNMPQASGFTWDVAGPPDPENGHCFTADTKVSLLDGTERTFADLAAGVAGDSFWVYSCDEGGNVVPGFAHSARKTRENAPIVEVELDNGEIIRCTGDHQFMMRDGSYREAASLVADDSLMPLYRKVNSGGYEMFYNPQTMGWRVTHQTSAFGVGGKANGLVAHHFDFNKRNNCPTNLVKMTPEDHNRLHMECASKAREYAQSDEGRAKSRELMSSLWSDPEWRAKQTARLRSTVSERGKTTAKRGKSGFKTMPIEIRRRNIAKAIAAAQAPEVQARAAEGQRRRFDSDPAFREKKVLIARQNLKKASGLPQTERQLTARRENVKIAHAARMSKIANNHKVVSVKFAGCEDVYDMTVDQHHNFALSAGVFVHNCVVGTGYDSTGVLFDTWGLIGTMTNAAVEQYAGSNDGGALYTVISQEMISKATQKAPNGFDFAALVADFDSLGGSVVQPPSEQPDWPNIFAEKA